jgi:hypothetical protein
MLIASTSCPLVPVTGRRKPRPCISSGLPHCCHFLRHIQYHRLANPSQGTAGDEDNARVILRLVRGACGVHCRAMYIH